MTSHIKMLQLVPSRKLEDMHGAYKHELCMADACDQVSE